MPEDGDLERVLRSAIAGLENAAIAYHVTGGLASSYYGEPRFTQDIDFVVQVELESLARLHQELEGEFLLDLEAARRAADRRAMFQALHRELIIKVDFHVGESCPGELERSRKVTLFPGLEVRLVSKEDALLSKLLWLKEGSGKSRQDIVGMLLDPTPYDRLLVTKLAEQLDCLELWSGLAAEISKD